jgi:hypothetical protein
MGVGAGVDGVAVAAGEVVATGEDEDVGAEVPLCFGVGWVVVPPHAATSAASASRPGAAPHLGPCFRVVAEILLSGGVWALRQDRARAGPAAPPSRSTLPDHTRQ